MSDKISSRLARFMNPPSIAIVGASDKGLYTAGILADLRRYGYRGRIYPVNPRRSEVGGLPCSPEIGALPEVPALVIIVIGRERVLDVVDQCIALGVPAALIITAGFGESDATGKALETELKRRIAGSDLAVIGPNCAGLANVLDEGMGAVVATRLPVAPQAGSVGFVSASGALMMALQGVFADLHLGMSRLISLGNQVDVSLTEALDYLVQDDSTWVIGAFVEGVADGDAFRRVAHAARMAGKPLVVVKSGRTAAGQKAAATHTAALAGSDAVFQAVCREAGALLVEEIGELARTLQLLSAWQGCFPTGKQLALVTQSGGMGSHTADLAAMQGFTLPEIAADLQATLQSQPHLLSFDPYGNPADVRGAGSVGPEAAATLELFLQREEFDSTLLLLAKSAVSDREIETAHGLVDLAQRTGRPFCLAWVGQSVAPDSGALAESLQILARGGVPVFDHVGDALRAIARAADSGAAAMRGQLPQTAPNRNMPDANAPSRWLTWQETAQLLGESGIRLVASEVVATPTEARSVADRIGYPVVAKLLASAHMHKSDAGLVRVNLMDAAALDAALAEMTQRVTDHEGILVQKMAGKGVEALIGVENDRQFGPVVACGVGGVLVELLGDVALRLPPFDRSAAQEMVNETRLAKLLAGYRGSPLADADALVELLVKIGDFALRHAGNLHSLDINPVIVHEQGLSLVDVRIQWSDSQ